MLFTIVKACAQESGYKYSTGKQEMTATPEVQFDQEVIHFTSTSLIIYYIWSNA